MSSDEPGRLAMIQPSKAAATKQEVLPPQLYPGNGSDGLQPLMQAVRAIAAESSPMPSERVLAEQLNVKRHQLRRALEALRGSGEIAPARAGRRAAPEASRGEHLVRATNPLEIIELRMVLEPALARLAALRASSFEISRIQRAAATPAEADPGAADLAFHTAVAAGSRNILAAEVYALLRHVGRDGRIRMSNGGSTCPNRIRQRDAEHAAIGEAIAARDPEGAEQAMRNHLAVVQRQIFARLVPGTSAA
jgi:GntR family transcriptional regulator, transcriptional repressor for pyruvate dehydrogenase complex